MKKLIRANSVSRGSGYIPIPNDANAMVENYIVLHNTTIDISAVVQELQGRVDQLEAESVVDTLIKAIEYMNKVERKLQRLREG